MLNDDSASEDEFARSDEEMMLTPDSAIENAPPGRKRAVAAKAKAKAPSRRNSTTTKAAPVKKTAVGAKRKALVEKDANVEDEDDEEQNKRVRKVMAEDTDSKKRRHAATSSRAAPRGASRDPQPRSYHSKHEEMDIEPSIEEIAHEPAARPVQVKRETSRAPSVTRQTSRYGSVRRAGSVSDSDRGGHDPILRRKLGDMTKKFESLDFKYQHLREIAIRDAETNFDKLKRSTDERSKTQEALIASLRRELASLRSGNTEVAGLRQQITTLQADNTLLTSENKKLTHSLHDAQNENRSLSSKVAAARQASTEPRQPPGSAVKGASQRTNVVGASDAAIKQLKEDLYSDLTGMYIRNVKRTDGEDVFDCLQSGRNGSTCPLHCSFIPTTNPFTALHFHLAVSSTSTGDNNSKTPGANSKNDYDEAEFEYTPHLDENRDRDLLDMLPDYLTEEIAFPRHQAAKFYSKILEAMNRRVVVED